MRHYTIYGRKNGAVLYQGRFSNFKSCVESALSDMCDLSYADLRYQDLSNVMLDDTNLLHADFTGSNLTGANLSEANLRACIFTDTALFNTCFAYSDLQSTNFSGASFGGTDITGCNMSFAAFSTLSWTNLDFAKVRLMKDCSFQVGASTIKLSKPPVVIKGLGRKPIIFIGNKVCYGHTQIECGGMHSWFDQLLSTRDNTPLKTTETIRG